MSVKSQVVVLGGGPGGYAAAFHAADLGLETTLIDKEENPGGVCLYRGCIPSKAYLHVAKLINESKESAEWGVEFQPPKIDAKKLSSWRASIVDKMTKGLGQIAKQRKVNFIQGTAKFKDSGTIIVTKSDESTEEVSFDKLILAAGSRPTKIPKLNVDSPRVLTSTGALDLPDIPETMLVIGGGYIGLELGSVYAALGTKVSVVEMTPGLLPGADRDLVTFVAKRIKRNFENVYVNSKVVDLKAHDDHVAVTFEGDEVKEKEQKFDKVLISVGRTPNSNDLGLENTKVEIDDKGFVKVNEKQQTTDEKIYAIGDIVGNPMLAHKASAEGKVAAEAISGEKVAFEPLAIPAVVFTDPELAWVGLTEIEAKEKGIKYEIAKFPWAASGRATTLGRNDGMTKLLIDPETEKILGVGIVGYGAGDLIAEGALAIEMGTLAKDLALTIHPHPTLSETLKEAAEVFFGHSSDIYRPKKK